MVGGRKEESESYPLNEEQHRRYFKRYEKFC